MKNRPPVLLLTAILSTGLVAVASAASIDVVVDAKSRPWNTDVNSSYSNGTAGSIAPLVIDASSGLDFSANALFTFTYLSGLTNPFPEGTPYANSSGDTARPVVGTSGSPGTGYPSQFITGTSPYYLNGLVGTFTNSSGVIVGNPFELDLNSSGPLSFALPTGATQLQLGFNDDVFGDNSGAITVRISSTARQPAPDSGATLFLLGTTLSGIVYAQRRASRLAPI